MDAFLRWTAIALALLLFVAAAFDRVVVYAAFHAGAGGLAVLSALFSRGRYASAFLLLFGAIDLYQATASTLGWFPRELFHYTPTDDLAHWVLGTLLVALGGFGLRLRRIR